MIEARHLDLLWDRYRDRLSGFIHSKVSDDEEAEDILQETFIRIHTGLCCMQEWTVMEKWIYRVTRNLIIDHYRSRKRSEELGEEFEAEAAAELSEDDPKVRLAFSLRETIDGMDEPYREALILTEYEGLTQVELAARAGISVSGAKSRVQRARAKLKALLLECCHFELDRLGGIIDYHERCCRCSTEPGGGRFPEGSSC
jgi:RNA polymerase sigma-70 factor, ECF subfamily